MYADHANVVLHNLLVKFYWLSEFGSGYMIGVQ